MKRYKFGQTITVDGVKYEAGDIVREDELHPGFLVPLLRQKVVSETAEPEPLPPDVPAPAVVEEVKPKAKK